MKGNVIADGRFRGKADMGRPIVAMTSTAYDPNRSLAGSKSRSAAVLRVLFLLFRSTGGTGQ
jgi:hypothetical protein